MNDLVYRNGVWVRPGSIAVSYFYRKVTEKGNTRFDGELEELIDLAHEHFDNQEPGTGSVDGDVILVQVPPERFRTNIVTIDETNAHRVEKIYHSRVKNETEVPQLIIVSDELKPKAHTAKLVLYRADTLARDNNRSSDAEWELIAVNAHPEADTPMHPETMRRNAGHHVGGTYREYSDEEWNRAEEYWAHHAFLKSPPTDDDL